MESMAIRIPKEAREYFRRISKLGASKGGKRRAEAMTPAERSEAARKAVRARWAKASPSRATIQTEPAPRRVASPDRSRELAWLAKHSREFAGMWVALDGDRLVASDPVARVVFSTARKRGVVRPFVARLEDADTPPFGGW
jgi:hypothetical protein